MASGSSGVAGPATVIVLLAGGTIYVFGYARAVMHRANSDYKKTKAILPDLRKDFWRGWWKAVKVGFWVVLGVVFLVMWTVHDARNGVR